MKFSEQWLREWVNPLLTSQQLADQLTMAGLEVEAITAAATPFSGILIGQVTAITDHPNANRLRVCQVTVGVNETLSIICGAYNVRAGLKVAVARVGATLSAGVMVQSVKLKGLQSDGMLCSTQELGLTKTATGIMELPDEAPLGVELWHYLQLADQCFEIHITPNRGDCLSIAGLARELAALNDLQVQEPVFAWQPPTITEKWPICVMAKSECPHYLGRLIKGLDTRAKTPIWMQERLRRSGLHSSHPVVDVTNYVLLEMGQPLHAFDQARLEPGLCVRHAVAGETLCLLNGKTIQLEADNTLVIADQKQAQALAGIIGGRTAAVSESTSAIFLESAFFNPTTLAGCARRYGLHTEAAYRFERGVDPTRCRPALERATQLLLAISGGQAGPVTEATNLIHCPPSRVITLRPARIQALLGMALSDIAIETILQRLGMKVSKQAVGWQVHIPSWRFDLCLEVDLIEELARIHGYDRIPVQQAQTPLLFLPLAEPPLPLTRLRHLWVDLGYHEIISYSFTALKGQQLLDPQRSPLALCNPLSSELAILRTSLWPGLLQAVSYNQKRQQLRMRLFEIGPSFLATATGVQQKALLAGVVTDSVHPLQWGLKSRKVDFFDIKSDIEACLALTRAAQLRFIPGQHPALQAEQNCALISQAGDTVGYLGALHPKIMVEYDLLGPIYLFELSLEMLTQASPLGFKPFSKFPFIRRDISFWITESVPFSAIIAVIKAHGGEWLIASYPFDVYSNPEEYPGKRSLALGLLWQHPTRTLTDIEVSTWVNQIIVALRQQFSVQLREEG